MLDWKKYLVAVIGVFVVSAVAGYVTHEVLLAGDYAGSTLWRTQEELWKRMILVYFAQLIFALAFCYVYTKGLEAGKSWLGQGIRYGLLIATLLFVPGSLVLYAVLKLELTMALKWMVFGYGQMLLAGIVAAAIYQPPPRLPHP
ncbi:MAG: hypothetical protein HY653_07165 [Acidobacteria bacterium]|nr:hypothetical protein [Acidobacteriota bacterium]